MPIGKNSIKRAVNNGYSNVKTTAPDMENSEVVTTETAKPAPKTTTAKKPCARKTATKKPAETPVPEAVKTEAAKAEVKAPAATPTAKKTVKKAPKKDGFKRVSFGEDMPYYLL